MLEYRLLMSCHHVAMACRYKQQGEASVEADNVFHHATYGAVQSSWLSSKHEQAALEVQINEFGQCPRQIFHAPHPPRLVCPDIPKAGGLPRQPPRTEGWQLSLSQLSESAAFSCCGSR